MLLVTRMLVHSWRYSFMFFSLWFLLETVIMWLFLDNWSIDRYIDIEMWNDIHLNGILSDMYSPLAACLPLQLHLVLPWQQLSPATSTCLEQQTIIIYLPTHSQRDDTMVTTRRLEFLYALQSRVYCMSFHLKGHTVVCVVSVSALLIYKKGSYCCFHSEEHIAT